GGFLVNAAFLLVTSALLVGQGADKKPAPAPAPGPAVVSSSSCGCDDCGSGHGLRGRFRGGLFHRNSCDTCQQSTCQSSCHQRERQQLFHSRCRDACQPRFNFHQSSSCCDSGRGHASASSCDSCERRGCLAKLRERFHRGNQCCDSGCANGGCVSTTTVPGKTPEKIDVTPKKMP